ncbi:GNAT family N-acetyltransferase [Nonomuraea typhae]|uniref:GNAT family N-acetyltransferase n=1 Tax=Nonomuraea typhae TaxID=2603600 RepID=UPI0012F8E656|nr:GNAT family N-acetyltransferase [Nonomuraea typhae]
MHVPASVPWEALGTAPPSTEVSATETATRAATRAGVRIRLAEGPSTLEPISRFLATVWQTPDSQSPFTPDVLRAFVHAGGAVHYASDEYGVAAASALVFCSPASLGVYSMIAAARASDQGVGYALKHAQRAWALEHGATSMIWTFDPLVSRNAHFNLAKLGARATEYAVDFYGRVDDGINRHDETDRLTAVWPLSDPRPSRLAGPDLDHAVVDPRLAPDGLPYSARDEDGHWCRVPLDIVTTRRLDRPLAARWRAAVRDVLRPAFEAGFTATGFSRSGWYQLTRKEQP